MGQKRELDLVQANENDESAQKRPKVAAKDCSKCGESKSLDQYNVDRSSTDGLRNHCKSCDRIAGKTYRDTRVGFLKRLLGHAIANTKKRNKKGRKHKCTLTLPELEKLITKQDGKCAISGAVLVFKSHSDSKASLDRIDDDVGYEYKNCRLVCLEFNTSVKWSRKLLVESIDRSGIPPEHFELETSDLETVLPTANSKGTVYRKWTTLTKDGISVVFCHHCSDTKPLSDFNKKISDGCKACKAQIEERNSSTWRGALHRLICSAENSTKRRNALRSEEDQTERTLTYVDLVGILKTQGGMCAYSRVALSPRMGDWKVSLERKDVTKGYTASNVCLVCQRFNAIDCSVRAKGAGACASPRGSGGWSRKKFLGYAALVAT